MATIRDVAKRAQVSVATVSHVLNDSRYVAPETKERVVAAIAELHYRRDGIARSLRRSETGTIGVMISDIANPFFSDLVKGIESTLHQDEDRLNVILCNTEEDPERERIYLDVLLEKRIDGLIMAPAGGNDAFLAHLVERSFPIVFVDRFLPGVAADSVMVDNVASAEQLVGHLIERGHRRIAVARATLHVSSIEERVEGYRRALAKAGLSFDPALIVDGASNIDAALEVGKAILALDPMPDAVFGTNNFMTLGVMRALSHRGLKCPDDLAIAGFDDFPWADSFRPRITAIAQPGFEMGQEAAKMLRDRMSKRQTGPAKRLTLDTELHLRESSG